MATAVSDVLKDFNVAALLPASGQFYTIDRLLGACEVGDWLDSVRVNSVTNPCADLGYHMVVHQTAIIQVSTTKIGTKSSYVVFENEVEPSFWEKKHTSAASLPERRYGYCLICEIDIGTDSFLFIQRLQAVNPLPHLLSALDVALPLPNVRQLTPYQFMHPWFHEDTRIERLSLRPMSLSSTALRKKTLEASDVRSTLSTLGIQRVVPGAMQVKGASKLALSLNLGGRFSLLPKSQRLSQKVERKRLSDLIEWAARAAAAFHYSKGAAKYPIDLLRALAQPLTTLSGERADSLLIECQILLDRVTANQLQIYWNGAATAKRDSDVIDSLDEAIGLSPLPLSSGKLSHVAFSGDFAVPDRYGNVLGAKVTVNTSTVSLQLTGAASYTVVDVVEYPDGRAIPLSTYIAEQKLYRVSMSGGGKLFCSEGAFTESRMNQSAEQLLQIFDELSGAAYVTSEKGLPKTNSRVFPKHSSFRMLIDQIGKHHALVCDDSTTEWCDFLAISSRGANKTVQWLHAKVKGTKSGKSTSASNLQDVVGQAIKNLSYLRLTKQQAITAKKRSFWDADYRVPMKNLTKIPRFYPNGSIATLPDFLDQLDRSASDPHARYIVGIVVPTISKTHIEKEFAKLGSGAASPEVIQMFWLLSGFMHSCLEVNARPVVYCRA